MTFAGLDAAAALMLSWLLTYAIHSTILLVVAAVVARRMLKYAPVTPMALTETRLSPTPMLVRD